MKILLYTYDIMKIGGIETSFFIFANHLKEKGYEVGVRYSVCDPMRLKKYIDSGIDICKEKQEACDILFIGSVWRRPRYITAKLVVQQVHADYSDEFWNGASAGVRMIKDSENQSDIFCPVSDSASRFVRKIVSKPVITLNNVAPVKTKIDRIKNKRMVFSAFTRMSSEKGSKNYQLFKKRIEELGIDAKFRVYTNGKAPEGWTLKDPVPDIKTELSDVDFVISLADTESFGYTIAEANSCGVPCVIKLANSTREFFGDDNLILDDVTNFSKKDLCRKISNYNLHNKTVKNVNNVIKQLEPMTSQRVIIRTMRRFRDLKAKKIRMPGELFSETVDRAKELINNDIKIVEKYE